MLRRVYLLFMFLLLSCTSCSAKGMFYYPDRWLHREPEKMGLSYELVNYPSGNGKLLSAMLFQTEKEPRGIIAHFHGNAQNISSHFTQSVFLLDYGFDVLIFDYQGFGASEGKPSPRHTVEDGLASIDYALSRDRSGRGVAIFGQSLGAAVGTVVAAERDDVKALMIEAGFTGYRAIMKDVMRQNFILWPFSFFVPSLTMKKEFDPIDYIGRLAPRPVLIIHGTKDKVIPPRMSQELFHAAQDPKELWMVRGAGHLDCQRQAREEYHEKLGKFFRSAFSGSGGEE